MPGLEHGLLPLALLCLRLQRGLAAPAGEGTDWGPYEPWTRPLVLLAQDRPAAAAAALRSTPDPPRDLLFEALWCLTARAAIDVGDTTTMERANHELAPAAAELGRSGQRPAQPGPGLPAPHRPCRRPRDGRTRGFLAGGTTPSGATTAIHGNRAWRW